MALNKGRIKKIPEERLREKDPELVSFFNINTPEDLERAEQLLSSGMGTEGARASHP
jgi:molybdopterin-guanine dinucleotide biosynthesis protein A